MHHQFYVESIESMLAETTANLGFHGNHGFHVEYLWNSQFYMESIAITHGFQYFTVPLPFLQESTRIHRNGTGIELELSEMRLENQYMYISTCIKINTTDTTP